jgi:hypothetical protein
MRFDEPAKIMAKFVSQPVLKNGMSRLLLLEVAVFKMNEALQNPTPENIKTAKVIGNLAMNAITCSAVH